MGMVKQVGIAGFAHTKNLNILNTENTTQEFHISQK